MTGKFNANPPGCGIRQNSATTRQQQEEPWPLTGMTPEQYRVYKYRFKLSPGDKTVCAQLDASLPGLKQRAITASSSEKNLADVELYKARKYFNDLNC